MSLSEEDKLKLRASYVVEKHEQYPDVVKPMYEANFEHEFGTGVWYAQFDTAYIKKLRNVCKVWKGSLYNFLGACLTDLGKGWNSYDHYYLNQGSVDFVIEHLEFYAQHGRWKIVGEK